METSKWKWFRYQDIFDIQKGKRLTKSDMDNGIVPFIGATDNNNGVTEYISNDEYLHSANVITVSYNGSIGNAFYQEKPFWASDDINVLYPRFLLNKYLASFLITVIEKEKYRFSYGNKWDRQTMLISKIKLPVLSDNSPDWNWIENYVKNTLIPQLPQTAQELFSDDFIPKAISPQKLTLDTKSWKWFRYEEIFDIQKGKRLTVSDMEEGIYPYVASGSTNNGIVALVDEHTHYAHAITYACYGSIGEVFYHEEPIWASDNVNVMIVKGITPNKYIGTFLVSLLDKEKYRFSYGLTAKMERLRSMKIKLPITPTGSPDWQWMEEYIKGLPYSSAL